MPAQTTKFTLFTAGRTLNSLQALANLKALCREHFLQRHEIEVVDVFLSPARALAAGVRLTPTLLRRSPAPQVRISGTLADGTAVLAALGIEAVVLP
ncbi:MAG: circadian clock KaiB family protein [Ramlibacter sp.]